MPQLLLAQRHHRCSSSSDSSMCRAVREVQHATSRPPSPAQATQVDMEDKNATSTLPSPAKTTQVDMKTRTPPAHYHHLPRPHRWTWKTRTPPAHHHYLPRPHRVDMEDTQHNATHRQESQSCITASVAETLDQHLIIKHLPGRACKGSPGGPVLLAPAVPARAQQQPWVASFLSSSLKRV